MKKFFNYGSIALWVGLILGIYMFAILANESSSNYQLRSKTDELENQIAKLESQIENLGYKITYYKTDSYREKLAREKLNVAAPGESVVVIKDDKRAQPSDIIPTAIVLKSDQQSLAEKPNYQQWWLFLFGN